FLFREWPGPGRKCWRPALLKTGRTAVRSCALRPCSWRWRGRGAASGTARRWTWTGSALWGRVSDAARLAIGDPESGPRPLCWSSRSGPACTGGRRNRYAKMFCFYNISCCNKSQDNTVTS
uniref:Uncharacterized protein n=1 Tax=Gouania willdenowi TaxID=441366 RepID=A0A8C5NE72_GOUWI